MADLIHELPAQIRDRGEDPASGEQSIYRYRDALRPHALTRIEDPAATELGRYTYFADGSVHQRSRPLASGSSVVSFGYNANGQIASQVDMTFAHAADARGVRESHLGATLHTPEPGYEYVAEGSVRRVNKHFFVGPHRVASAARDWTAPSVSGGAPLARLPDLDPRQPIALVYGAGVLVLVGLAFGGAHRRRLPVALRLVACATLAGTAPFLVAGIPGAGASFGIHGHEALFYLTDPLGSTVVSVMPTAGIRNRYLHRPFGDATVQEGVDLRHRFTGGPRNPYGLYQLGARTYDPDAGRFLQPDPLVGDPGLSQAYNRYGYVYNNPLAWADPSGLRADAREAGRSNFWLTVTLGFGDGGNDERPRPLYPLPHRASVVALEQGRSAGGTPGSVRPVGVSQSGQQGGGFWSGVGNVVGKIWNLPNTALGLAYGAIGGLIDATVQVATLGHVDLGFGASIGNNAIQFTNHPLQRLFGGGAITLGNSIAFGGLPGDAAPTSVPFVSVPIGTHELQHTFQGQVLGPLYLPANIIGGVAGTLGTPFTGPGPGGSPWHGPLNFMERGPLAVPPRPWP